MREHWIKKTGAPDLLLLVLGWAADEHIAEHVAPEGYDVLCTFDYRDLRPLEASLATPYRRVVLAAWSFGIWAAETICRNIPPDRAIALNGTPYPVDDRLGIPRRAMSVTLKGIRRSGTEAFERKTYAEHYERIAARRPVRTNEELCDELSALCERSAAPYTPHIGWDRAVVGLRDEIFPVPNMLACWGDKAVTADLPHYPFGDLPLFCDLLNPKP